MVFEIANLKMRFVVCDFCARIYIFKIICEQL